MSEPETDPDPAPPATPVTTPVKKDNSVSWIIAFVLAFACCGIVALNNHNSSSPGTGDSHTEDVTRATLGDDWPLTVGRGTLECRNGSDVVFTADGTTYAVNGTAMGTGNWADITDIWALDPALGNGLRKGMGPLISEGLALC